MHRTKCALYGFLPGALRTPGLIAVQIWCSSLPSASLGQDRTLNPAEGPTEPEIQPTFLSGQASCLAQGCLTRKKGHHYQICTEPPLGHWAQYVTLWKVRCSQGLPRPQASGQHWAKSVVLAQGLVPLPEPGGRRGETADVWKPEPGRSQASTCLWMKMHWGGQQKGQEAVPGNDRICPAQGLLLERSKEAAEGGGLRKPECPHMWEPHFPAISQLEIPTGPTLEKQPLGHGAHIPPSGPLPVQVSLARPQQVKTLPRSQNWSGNSGLLIPSPVAFQHIFIASPGKGQGVGMRADSSMHLLLGDLGF